MGSKWVVTDIGRLSDQGWISIQTGPFGSQLHAYDYEPIGIPVVPTEAIGRRILHTEDIPRVSNETAERLSRHRLKPGDILFARRGVQATGFSALVKTEHENWLCGTGAIRLRIHDGDIEAEFLSFVLADDKSIEWFKVQAVGAVMPNLNEGIIRRFPLLLPPLPEQRAIARVLGSLDDKIELNRKLNATLEETARTIFQSWFVDFDPVRAKAAGRAPAGLDAATAALFPDSFEEIEGRMVPEGWKLGRIGDLVSVVGGGTPSTKEPAYWDEGDIHWTTPKDLSSLSSPILLDTERYITKLGLQQISSALLPEGTVLLSSRAPIGYLAITKIPTAINQGFIAMVCDQEVPNYYALLWAKANLELIRSRANGTTFLEISKSNFRSIEILVPPQEILGLFVSAVESIYELMRKNMEQSYTLIHLRDTLLPRLLSGDLRVDI